MVQYSTERALQLKNNSKKLVQEWRRGRTVHCPSWNEKRDNIKGAEDTRHQEKDQSDGKVEICRNPRACLARQGALTVREGEETATSWGKVE